MAPPAVLFLSHRHVRGRTVDKEFVQTLQMIARERDISETELIAEAEEALAAAYKKHVGATGDVTVRIDTEKGSLHAICEKEVVGHVTNGFFQMSLEDARKKDPKAEIGDFIPVEIAPESFGRIAAQTFKQVLQQRLREAERKRTLELFSERQGDVVSAVVTRREGPDVILQAGRSECLLRREDQVRNEPYRINDRIRVYVRGVEETRRGPRVRVSRRADELLAKLFEMEVPEIEQGTVEIKGVAREPGVRSKITVVSHDERVDAVGACVGQRGARVQAIVNELYDEKIDIIPYSDDVSAFIAGALSPAKVSSVRLNQVEKRADVIVPDSQLSLAIGKGGVNARLAHKLTGWNIDIRSESQVAEEGGNAQS
ncbi:MAG: Transcription termination/antitermination protein NusA [Fimbriimonadales bacterium]|nr:Transcription termination/antitermination protein NusA [Fimbriimonadales bacterium]